MTSTTPIIEFKGITKRFGGITALKDVTFPVAPGGVHALVGENGAGKSTLIKVCGGALQPDAGQMVLQGREVSFANPQASQNAGISIVHQEIPICPHLTATENIFLGRPLPKRAGLVDWKAANVRAKAFFDRFRADINPNDIVGRLPIAKQQMVEIAQALFLESQLLIMDEPTSALGKAETDRLFEIIRELTAQGITIVYVSHRLEEVFEIADRVTALRDGQYIDTVPIKDVTPDDVVTMMVGREIHELFPKVHHERQQESLLRVRSLSAPRKFQNVSFDLYAGEVLGLVGLQGSGTSETMRALFGHVRDVSGEISIKGKPVSIRSPLEAIRNGIAYVPADRKGEGLFSVMNVRDNSGILILKRISRWLGWVSNRLLNRHAQEAVRTYNVRSRSIYQMISSLSGGNQQKVVVAKALSTNPLIVLMDDPTRGVDVGAKAEIHHLLNDLTAQGHGVIMSSSELPEVLAMSDRVLVMYRGEVKATLTREEANRDLVMGLATGVGRRTGTSQLVGKLQEAERVE